MPQNFAWDPSSPSVFQTPEGDEFLARGDFPGGITIDIGSGSGGTVFDPDSGVPTFTATGTAQAPLQSNLMWLIVAILIALMVWLVIKR